MQNATKLQREFAVLKDAKGILPNPGVTELKKTYVLPTGCSSKTCQRATDWKELLESFPAIDLTL